MRKLTALGCVLIGVIGCGADNSEAGDQGASASTGDVTSVVVTCKDGRVERHTVQEIKDDKNVCLPDIFDPASCSGSELDQAGLLALLERIGGKGATSARIGLLLKDAGVTGFRNRDCGTSGCGPWEKDPDGIFLPGGKGPFMARLDLVQGKVRVGLIESTVLVAECTPGAATTSVSAPDRACDFSVLHGVAPRLSAAGRSEADDGVEVDNASAIVTDRCIRFALNSAGPHPDALLDDVSEAVVLFKVPQP